MGRWPVGLWTGPATLDKPRKAAGGVSLDDQQSITIRLNRARNEPSGQAAKFEPYVYALNRECSSRTAPCFGDAVRDLASPPSPRGRWFDVALYVSMNEAGKSNGCVALWHDGQMVGERCDFDLGADRGWMVRGVYGFSMWHCNGSPKAQRYWMTNYSLYTN